MEAKKHFEKHFSKLKSEALVRSLLAALIIGFVAGFVAAVITWFTNLNGLWISIAALVVATAVAAPIFYAKKYRPTALRSARRIDRLGLEERLVTMVEYEGNRAAETENRKKYFGNIGCHRRAWPGYDGSKRLECLRPAAQRLGNAGCHDTG